VPQSKSIDNRREPAFRASKPLVSDFLRRILTAPLFTYVYGACVFANPWPSVCPSYFEGLSNTIEPTTSFFATADFGGLADASGHVEEEAEEAIEVVQ